MQLASYLKINQYILVACVTFSAMTRLLWLSRSTYCVLLIGHAGTHSGRTAGCSAFSSTRKSGPSSRNRLNRYPENNGFGNLWYVNICLYVLQSYMRKLNPTTIITFHFTLKSPWWKLSKHNFTNTWLLDCFSSAFDMSWEMSGCYKIAQFFY